MFKNTFLLTLCLLSFSLLIPLKNTNAFDNSQIVPNKIQGNMISRLSGKVDPKVVNLEQFREEHSPDVLLIKFKSSITKNKQKQLIGSDASFLYEYSLVPGLVACKFEKGIENGLLKLGNRSDVIEVIEPDLIVSIMNDSNRGLESACPEGEQEDCNGNCFPTDWIGDGYCDDGSYYWNGVEIYLNCDEFACDGGDCFCDDGLEYACCIPNECQTLTFAECNEIGGSFQPNVQCSDNETLCDFPESWGLQAIDSPEAWNISSGRAKTIVAVLDTGIDTDHIEFNGLLWVNENEIPGNGIDDDNNGAIDDINGCGTWDGSGILSGDLIEDAQGHGTHVSGTVASESFGVLKNARLMTVAVLSPSGSGSTSGIIMGIDYAVNNGAKVINMSLGGYGQSLSYQSAIDAALDLGVVTVVSAGNDNANSCNYSPAFVTNAVTVGSFGIWSEMGDFARSWFSNWGPCNDLFAPGTDIVSASIDGMYLTASGTSMAAPHVAGVATAIYDFALPYTYNEIDNPTGLTPMQIAASISLLLETTSDVDVVQDPNGSDNLALNFANAMELLAPCDADLNRNGNVTVDDVLVLLGSWNTDSGDINFDGTTDVNDLLALLALWNQTCPFPNIAQEIKYGCCMPDMALCQDVTKAECLNLGGNPLDTICSTSACYYRACCFEDGTCANATADECSALGGNWNSYGDCSEVYCPVLITCENDGDGPTSPYGAWLFSTSDTGSGTTRAVDVAGQSGTLTVYGIGASNNNGSWSNCPGGISEMIVTTYASDWSILSEETVSVSGVPTGDMYGGYELVEFNTGVAISGASFMGVRSNSSGEGECWFYWITAGEDGQANTSYVDNGDGFNADGRSVAYCLDYYYSACCLEDGTCTLAKADECFALGGNWNSTGDCSEVYCPVLITCENDGDGPTSPYGAWGGSTSDTGSGVRYAVDVAGQSGTLTVYGFGVLYDADLGQYMNCPSGISEMVVTTYASDWSILSEETVSVSGVPTGDMYGGYYDLVQFNTGVSISGASFMGVRSNSSGQGECWFYWSWAGEDGKANTSYWDVDWDEDGFNVSCCGVAYCLD